ncbi:MAG: ATP synthase F1 subunit epsilon [Chitinophagales bacterium]|nr:ATP synthase F1 subunit epsilon [Chitinophagales bacterium]MDW8420184.1 ATP synthase F1 subunit epsilon [Chitinophagales bacterium]
MTLEILTPEKKIFSGEATLVQLPGVDGSFEILSHHAPLIAALAKGQMKYKTSEGETTLTIGGGFVECLNNRVIVCAESAE